MSTATQLLAIMFEVSQDLDAKTNRLDDAREEIERAKQENDRLREEVARLTHLATDLNNRCLDLNAKLAKEIEVSKEIARQVNRPRRRR